MSVRRLLMAAVAAPAVAAAGCGLGAGQSGQGEAELRVTRDYGAQLVAEATVSDPSESETVIRMLDREAELETRYGGGFVQSIDGIAGGVDGGRSFDWFFYVNGIESPVGSAEVAVNADDRIWWDHRDWTDAMRVPAVVGSWPQPFAQAGGGADRTPVRVECAAERPVCNDVAARLSAEGAEPSIAELRPPGEPPAGPRMLVGEWGRIRRDPAAKLLAGGPARSGVFVSFGRRGGGWELVPLEADATPGPAIGRGAGLVAAVREGEEPPAWLVTGTDPAGVEAAAGLLSQQELQDRYAVAVGGDGAMALPAAEEEGG